LKRKLLAMAFIMAALSLLSACGSERPEVFQAVEPQTQTLMLLLTSPEVNLVTSADRVAVSGVTSPDATLSVNGRLALSDPQGRFSIDLERPRAGGPLVIEVVATSITGESKSQLRPVIFSDGGGVFGTVTSVTPSEITLQTGPSQITLTHDATTSVAIHGWKSPSVSHVARDTQVAIMTDGPRALSVLAIPVRPVNTRHFTGLVAAPDHGGSVDEWTLELRGDSGLTVTATAIDGLEAPPAGVLVTAVLAQDISSGRLTISAFDQALAAAERLDEALTLNRGIDTPEASANMAGLGWRLAEHGARNLSMLAGAMSDEGRREAIAKAGAVYTDLFSEHRLGVPFADVTGLVTSIDSRTGQVTVQPSVGPAVMVKISHDTPVALFGERVRSGQLDLASRVTVRYALSGNDASRVAVLAGGTLPDVSSQRLARSAGRGEVQGTLVHVGTGGQIITILDHSSRNEISFPASGTVFFENGSPATLSSAVAGSHVFARYDPDSYRLLELEALAPIRGEELVSGVVHSFIPKLADGNLTIRTPDGRLRRFTHTADTFIRREGLSVPISQVRPGDLVRPNTRIRPSDTPGGRAGEIVVLNLKAPEPGLITGFIRGVSGGEDGRGGFARVTISNIWFELISLRVGPDTKIAEQGRALDVADLAVGQKVARGFYDPVTLVAGNLTLDRPTEAARTGLAPRR